MQKQYLNTHSDPEFLEFLEKEHLIDESAARRVQVASHEAGASIEGTLLEFGLISEEKLFQALARFLALEFLEPGQIDLSLLNDLALPNDFLKRAEIVPAKALRDGILFAMADPRRQDIIESVAFYLKQPISIAVASPSTIKTALLAATVPEDTISDETSASDAERLTALANDGPVIKLVNDIIVQAAGSGASDIHIESGETEALVRFRVDGVLQVHRSLPDATRAAVISRLKIMARLNISEKRRPQDGRAQVSVRGRLVDLRLSTLPTQFGESVVLRLLDRARISLSWEALGYVPERVNQIESAVGQPNGVFLVVGPTGSGKTTTLYTAIGGLNTRERKIVTVEDPIEYSLPGINQVQVEPEIDMNFARALRAILRQDPDVIMLGEIRDEETAEIAIRAALVGRMVLSTVHTNDSVSTITRLRDLGVPSYLLAATLRGVLSQRLLRTYCSDCEGAGCDSCKGTGQRGRTVVSEFLSITPRLAASIADGAEADTLARQAEDDGFLSMQKSAQRLIEMRKVSEDEAIRAIGTGDF